METAIAIGLLILFVGGSIWARRSDRTLWNDGLCSECLTRWICFDVASDMSRGYRCSGCSRTRRIWISWGVDKHPRLVDAA